MRKTSWTWFDWLCATLVLTIGAMMYIEFVKQWWRTGGVW